MQHLLSLGLDPNATSSGRETVLITACKGSHAHVAQLLLRAGAAVDAVDRDGCSALYDAAQCCSFAATAEDKGQCLETARVLLSAGADVLRSPRCLHAAVYSICSSFLQHRIALAQQGGAAAAGSVAAAAAASQTDMVKLLPEHSAGASSALEATASSCSCCGDTTALQACTDAAALKLLLAAGASVQARTSKGNTCLHTAAAHGHSAPVICLLIKAGADLTAVNSNGKTAAQLARIRGHKPAEALLNRAAQG
jgi:uncharacterized protein